MLGRIRPVANGGRHAKVEEINKGWQLGERPPIFKLDIKMTLQKRV